MKMEVNKNGRVYNPNEFKSIYELHKEQFPDEYADEEDE